MDIFRCRARLIDEYAQFSRSFVRVAAEDLKEAVEREYARQRCWPAPLIQLNANYRLSRSVQDLARDGALHSGGANVFRVGKDPSVPGSGADLRLYRHQEQAITRAHQRRSFFVPRALELAYTAHDLRPFYDDVVADNPALDPRSGSDRGRPFPWDPVRRAQLRAELDAYFARLYGLTRDELRFVLDPRDVYGPDYPSETFRVLRDNKLRAFGEYRTRRKVLDARDRFQSEALR